MTPSRENQENDGTARTSETSHPVESLLSPPQQQRRSARRRSINPKLLEAASNGSVTQKRRKVANNEEKAQAAAPAEKSTTDSDAIAADSTPRKSKKAAERNEKEPPASTRKSARKPCTANKDEPLTPLSTRKSARKRGKEEAEEKSKIIAPTPTSLFSVPRSEARSSRKSHKTSSFTKPENFAFAMICTDPCSSSHVPLSAITADQINETAQKLFESEESQVLDRRCILARLFACFFLQSGYGTASTNTLDSILPLLKVLVHVEATALGPTPLPSNSPPPTKRQRRVEFSAYDCSSTKPPVDREPSSGVHQQETIEAMIKAKEEIQSLTVGASAAVQQLRHFLENILRDDCLLQVTAAAVAPDFPPKRVSSLAGIQSLDFERLQRRLSKMPFDTVLSPLQSSQIMMSSTDYEPISVEHNLAELLGQAIRFQLRKLLNLQPVRLSKVNEDYDQMAETYYSKVGSLVQLTSNAAGNTPVDEGFLSAPFSVALQRLYEYFDLPKLLDSSNTPLQLPTAFCASEPSQRGLPTRPRNAEPVSQQNVEMILDDIYAATSFLAAARAARFLFDLLAAPGVQDEITRMGGWGEIETYASCIWKNDFWKFCEADAHLVSLCNVAALHHRLQVYCTAMEVLTDSCEASLQQLHDNLHLSTKSAALLRSFPCIKVIADSYEQGMKLANAFPHVDPVL